MPKILYIDRNFREDSLALIAIANNIIDEYAEQDFSLTLRQLYYQMVARDIILNSQKEYKRLGGIIANARLAGLIDWLAIVDRTRELRGNSHWASPRHIMRSAIKGYRIDKWAEQPCRIEVWIEKDALVGVISGICQELDIDYFSCRGYTSASEMWSAAQRLREYLDDGQDPIVLHFGDHDPSGIDMTRDIAERLALLADCPVDVQRMALNQDQIDLYGPPPNPTKLTDSRAPGYIAIHGYDSWELDALEPGTIVELISDEVHDIRDADLWTEATQREAEHREILRLAAENM